MQTNIDGGDQDPDKGITMALFSYPILMAADILMFRSSKVPVGQDQKQHVEMARDIAQRFNHHYGETFVLPEAVIGEHTAVLQGAGRAQDVEELQQHDSAVRRRESVAQADHEDQDQQPRARRTQGYGRQHAVRHLQGVCERRGDARDGREAMRPALPGAK